MADAIVLRTAGTNCDYETVHALEKVGFKVSLTHVNALIKKPTILMNYQLLAIPGGFSYGDYIASGKILANKLLYRLKNTVPNFIEQGGLAIGICNGFQVLVKAGLLPALEPNSGIAEATLTFNDSGRFQCEWVKLRRNSQSKCIFTKNMKDEIYLPIAHAEGKFIARDDILLKTLKENQQIVLQYINNPNGSQENIAGVCDKTGRVFGMMPHPERNIYPENDPRSLREEIGENGDGLAIFWNAIKYLENK